MSLEVNAADIIVTLSPIEAMHLVSTNMQLALHTQDVSSFGQECRFNVYTPELFMVHITVYDSHYSL